MENLKEYFEEQCTKKEEIKFNIFSALHRETDEVRLHSRFISFLLSPNSKHLLSPNSHHGMGNEFLKSFVKSVLNIDFDCENCIVKSEDKDIDIFISNGKQEIIIENKIYARDQPFQLIKYYNKKITKNAKGEKEIVKVVYLTLGKHKPSDDSLGNIPQEIIRLIDYTQDINEWLTNCIAIAERKDNLLSKIINQYKELITKLTSDVGQAKENQQVVSDKIDEAWNLEKHFNNFFTDECKDIFKHVKWHTVADFINEMEVCLIEKGAVEIEKPDAKTITRITHNNSRKAKLIIKFKFNNTSLQIVNDSKGFTLGNLTDGKWDYFLDKIKDIRFCDFSKENTFHIINEKKRNEIIEKITNEVVQKYNDLTYDF